MAKCDIAKIASLAIAIALVISIIPLLQIAIAKPGNPKDDFLSEKVRSNVNVTKGQITYIGDIPAIADFGLINGTASGSIMGRYIYGYRTIFAIPAGKTPPTRIWQMKYTGDRRMVHDKTTLRPYETERWEVDLNGDGIVDYHLYITDVEETPERDFALAYGFGRPNVIWTSELVDVYASFWWI